MKLYKLIPQSRCFSYFSVAASVYILLMIISFIKTESFGSDVDERLGVAYEFKIHVDPGKEDCFFQHVHPHSSLYVAFQVMRGGDSKAGFAIRNPSGAFALPYKWSESAEHEETTVQTGGYYQFCIDNSLSRFAPKLVSLYVASFKRDEWEKYIEELSGQDVTVSNFTASLANVDQNIGFMLKSLDQSRRSHSHDQYLVEANLSYVQTWSIIQCSVIVISSLVQIYFVKKLFDDESGGSKGVRPRA